MKLKYLIVVSLALFSLSTTTTNAGNSLDIMVDPIREKWPIMREVDGDWDVKGEVHLFNETESMLRLTGISITAIDDDSKVLAVRHYKRKDFREMLLLVSEDDEIIPPKTGKLVTGG